MNKSSIYAIIVIALLLCIDFLPLISLDYQGLVLAGLIILGTISSIITMYGIFKFKDKILYIIPLFVFIVALMFGIFVMLSPLQTNTFYFVCLLIPPVALLLYSAGNGILNIVRFIFSQKLM